MREALTKLGPFLSSKSNCLEDVAAIDGFEKIFGLVIEKQNGPLTK